MEAYEKLEKLIAEFELILHPTVFTVFKKALLDCYEENKRDAYKAANVSTEALLIEHKILECRKSIAFHKNAEFERFLYKTLYKEFLQAVKKPLTPTKDTEPSLLL